MATWVHGSVYSVGTGRDGSITVFLNKKNQQDQVLFTRYYKASRENADRILATALSAIATGNTVGAYFTDNDNEGSVIDTLYLNTWKVIRPSDQ